MDLSHVGTLLESFHEIGGRYLTISGGEPLVREDCPDILVTSLGLGIETILFTNGILLNGRLDELPIDNLKIVISLDGDAPPQAGAFLAGGHALLVAQPEGPTETAPGRHNR